MRARHDIRRVAAVCWFGAMALHGCGDSSTPPEETPYSPSPDEVVAALARAYETFDPEALRIILSDDFVFVASTADVDSGIDSSWTREYELECARNLLTGQEGRWPDGSVQAPVDTAFPLGTLLLPVAGSSWVEIEGGAFERRYLGFMQVQYVTGDLDFIEGEHRFVVAPVSTAPGAGYVLRCWQDFGLTNPTRSRVQHRIFSWGWLKSLFDGQGSAAAR